MPRKRKVPVVVEEKENESTVSHNTTIHHGPMYTIMSNVQLNETFHKKYIREMINLYEKMDHDAFMFTFIKMVKSAMEADETNEYAYTTLLFCAKFVAAFNFEEVHPVLVGTCRWLLGTISQNPHIRFRLCQFVNMILNALGVEVSLDDSICDEILEYMLKRLRDMNPNVRVQAILALQRLQCPDNPDDIVLRVYQFHLCSDPSPRVRQAVITSMGRNYNTIPYILERLWDIDEKVRRHTYLHMSGYPVKAYKVSQRLQLLEQGLNDRSEMVKKVVTTIMLPQWLESYNKNYMSFVSALKLDASEAEVERFLKIAKVALHAIFKRQDKEELIRCLPIEEDGEFHKCVPMEKLSMEVTLYWQCLVEHLQAEMADELDMIIPELSTFCAYVSRFCEAQKNQMDKFIKMEFQYILLSLCKILYLYDLGDEIGRENLKKLITTILISNELEEKIIEVIVRCTENLITDQNNRLQFFIEIIEEMTQTSSFKNDTLINDRVLIEELLEKHPDKDLKLKLSSLKVKILDLEEQEMNYVEKKDYVQAHRITEEKNAITEEYANLLKPLLEKHSTSLNSDQAKSISTCIPQSKKVTPETILKSLQLAFHMVVSKNVKSLTPNVCKLYNEFIGRHIASNQIAIRDWALKCGTAYSMLYEALAKEIYEVLYAQFFKNHNIRIWKTSITCIFELLDRYGCSSFNVDERQNKSKRPGRQLYNTLEFLDADDDSSVWTSGQAVDIIFMMSHFLDTCDDVCIISAIVNGFCRLVLHDHIKNPEILEKLLLRYFNPSTDAEINQILGVFFENLLQRKKQEYLHPCLLPTVSQVISAPYESPLHEIKPETILRFVIDSTQAECCAPGANIHNKLALSFLQEMQNNIANKDLCRILSKELLTLQISVQDDLELKDNLKGIAEKLIKCEFDSRTLKHILDFKDMLDGVFNPPLRHANVDGSDEEEKSDDETVSAITNEKEFEKRPPSERMSNRLQPVVEEENNCEQEGALETVQEEKETSQEESESVTEKNGTKKNDNLKQKNKRNTRRKGNDNQNILEEEKTSDKEITTDKGNSINAESSADKESTAAIGKEITVEKESAAEKESATEKDSPAEKENTPEKGKSTAEKENTIEKESISGRKSNAEKETSGEKDSTVDKPTSPARKKQLQKGKSQKNAKTAEKETEPEPTADPPPKPIGESSIPATPTNQTHISTPTTYGRENSTGLRYLRKSMNSSRNNTVSEGEPSPKIRIEARIDTVITPQKEQSTINNSTRATRRNLRFNANSQSATDNTEQSTTKQQSASKERRKIFATPSRPTRKVNSKTPRRKEASSSEDSDDSEIIPPSPTSFVVPEAQSILSSTRRINRALRYNNTQNPKVVTASATKPTKSNRNNAVLELAATPEKQQPVRSTRKRPISPRITKEGDNEFPSPLRKQSKTSVNISDKTTAPTTTINPKTTLSNQQTNASDQQPTSPITNKLKAKNSNVPEKPSQPTKTTRSVQKKPTSPSSKENEPKSPSKSIASNTSMEYLVMSSSDEDNEPLAKTPSAKQRSSFLLTKSTEKRLTNSKNPLLVVRRSNTSSSVGRVSTRNSARRDRQNNMIMTRKRLSLENVKSPLKKLTTPKATSKKPPTTATTAVLPKASKIPVNLALRANKSKVVVYKANISKNVSSNSSDSSISASQSSSNASSGDEYTNTTSTKKIPVQQTKPSVQNRLTSLASQRATTISRIARSTRTKNTTAMLRKRNI